MRSKLHRASTIAVIATLLTTIFSAEGSGAAAQDIVSGAAIIGPSAQFPAAKLPASQFVAQPVVQPLAEAETREEADAEAEPRISAGSLAQLVAAQPATDLSPELSCLAGAIYFEAKSESLEGQLAVGRVIVARSKSGRFPGSYCGVVFQRSQFSFVRGNSMPAIGKSSRQWRTAAAVAQIAHEGSWRSPVEGALFFHATHVNPRWRLTRMARVQNHVFYR